MKAYTFASLATILIWGMYPVGVAMGGYGSPFFAAAISTACAAIIWAGALAFSPIGVRELLAKAMTRKSILLFSGILFAAEVAFFYVAVSRSPQTAAVLFEVWVLVFVFLSQIMGGVRTLNRKDWVFLCFGLIGISVAVVDVRAMLSGFSSIPDPISVICALLSGAVMAVKTYLNAELSRSFYDKPSVVVASLPHLLSCFVAIPIWLGLVYLTDGAFRVAPSEIDGVVLVALFYGIGVPVFIYAVSLRPNDASMAVYYSIPLVAIGLLYVFGFGELTFYFIIGASIIFVSNAMVSQSTPYISAAGLSAVLTLIATYFAISVQTDVLPISAWVRETDTVTAVEILLIFYGLLFAFVLNNVMVTNKYVHRQLDETLNALLVRDIATDVRAALYRRLHRLNLNSGWRSTFVPPETTYDQQSQLAELEIEYRSLNSSSTPTAIFRVFSVGVMAVVLGTFCLSDSVLERIAGFLVLSCVLYFVFYSRDSYLRNVTYPMLFAEVLAKRRGRQHLARYTARLSNHIMGMWLFVYALLVCLMLNIWAVQ